MIGHLRGTLADRYGSTVIVDCGGVGYEVTVSTHSMAGVGELGSELVLKIFTQAQENKIALYGFASTEERQLFDQLITVKRVGPSSAIKILSAGAEPAALARLIASEQLGSLKSMKGVGKKTAELLVVELREKCELLLASWGAQGGPVDGSVGAGAPNVVEDPLMKEVLGAMVQLGWKRAEVEKNLSQLEVVETDDFESLLRRALRAMPR